jgi:tRNA G18 (ribose-2'-O)-methylase SpoU
MERGAHAGEPRGYFGIGIWHGKSECNVGTLWRSAYQLGAAFIFTVGPRYKRQASDTTKAWRHVPLLTFTDIDDLISHLPYACPLVAVEMGYEPLRGFLHPQRCAYLLGAEDHGLPSDIISRCQEAISLEAERMASYNVAVAGSLVMYDRFVKAQ